MLMLAGNCVESLQQHLHQSLYVRLGVSLTIFPYAQKRNLGLIVLLSTRKSKRHISSVASIVCSSGLHIHTDSISGDLCPRGKQECWREFTPLRNVNCFSREIAPVSLAAQAFARRVPHLIPTLLRNGPLFVLRVYREKPQVVG